VCRSCSAPSPSVGRVGGQAVHQVQIQVVEAGPARNGGGAQRIVPAVNAAFARSLIAKALYADRQAIHTGFAKGREAACLNRARIGLQRDLDIRPRARCAPDAVEQRAHRITGKQARCAAAHEHADHAPTLGHPGFGIQILQQRLST
jgi:hypothetical protein